MKPWLLWVWRAWHRLSADRPWVGGGLAAPMPVRIPWTAVRTWSDHHGLSRAEMEFLDMGLRAMDGVFLEHWRAQQGKPAAQTLEEKLARWDKAE